MRGSQSYQQWIESRWPEVGKALAQAPWTAAQLLTDTPCPTLLVGELHLTSCYDRSAEAALQASRVPPGTLRVAVYGFALGDLQRALLARPELEELTVVILNPSVVRESLSRFDHDDWLYDPRVRLVLGSAETQLRRPFAVAPACLHLVEERASHVREHLVLELSAPYQKEKHEARAALLEASMQQNRVFIEKDGDVGCLFDTRLGGIGVIAAAGPTLSDGYDYIRKRTKSGVLIAVTTSVVPLQKAGITPDVVVVADPNPELIRHFDGLDRAALNLTPLVYLPSVHPEVLRSWPGPRLAAYLDHPRYAALRSEFPRGTLFCSGTVTHMATDLAVQMGCKEVVLLGADFCYPRQRTHVPGAVLGRPLEKVAGSQVLVANGRGERVPTDISLLGYRIDLEHYIAEHPQVRFWKMGRDGAQIAGAAWMEEP